MEKQKDPIKKEKILIIDWLVEHFPNAFFKKTNEVKPLQIGIFEEILDFYERLDHAPFSKKSLREALSYYSSSPAYLNSQKPNAARVDLFGNEVDIITEQQAKFAKQRHQERYSKKES